ncbi:uncharacterized protein [Panulirus ornatus]|uniref:uncharacterized protein n=1 Tax=Panulirus ornatus TaxID=150431 RepID=UPI003A8C2102
MMSRWEGQHLLVRLSGAIRFCCDLGASQEPPLEPDIPPGYRRDHQGLDDDLHLVTDAEPWDQLLLNHRMEGPRYTILPTISVVNPWDDEGDLLHDQVFGGSDPGHVIVPTAVLPSLPATPIPSLRPALARDAALNATHRFYNALQAVLHGSGPGTIRTLREETQHTGVDAVVVGISPHVQETSDPILSPHHDPAHDTSMSPLLQVCTALGVLVVVMVVLFHSHHFRRDCMTERRALRRVARRYHVARAQDDVEKNEPSDVTDVTL